MDRTQIGWRLRRWVRGRGTGWASTVGCFAPALHPAPTVTCQDGGPVRDLAKQRPQGGARLRRRIRHRPVRRRPARRRRRRRRRRAGGFVGGGKCLRSTFMFLGWLCGADAVDAALRAAASLELLHAFALLQDDVMDGSPLRRGRPVGPCCSSPMAPRPRTVRLAGAVRRIGGGPARRPVPGVGRADAARKRPRLHRAERAWPRYDAMRTELAVGQFADLVNDVGGLPYAG